MLLRATFQISLNARVIVLGVSGDDEAQIVACAEAGVCGFHLRTESLDDLLVLIGKVASGESLVSQESRRCCSAGCWHSLRGGKRRRKN